MIIVVHCNGLAVCLLTLSNYLIKGMSRFMRKKLSICVLLIIVLAISIISETALAVKETCSHGRRTFNDKKLASGVGDYGNKTRYYWIDSDFSSTYKECIRTAFNNWTKTSSNPGVTTPISIKESSLKSDATFEIHKKTLSGNTTGITEFYSYSQQVADASSKNWTWNKIFIDASQTKNYPKNQKVGLVEHEVGHAMGLSHQPNNPTGSIMYNYDDGRKFSNGEYRNRPSKKDCNNINHIY